MDTNLAHRILQNAPVGSPAWNNARAALTAEHLSAMSRAPASSGRLAGYRSAQIANDAGDYYATRDAIRGRAQS